MRKKSHFAATSAVAAAAACLALAAPAQANGRSDHGPHHTPTGHGARCSASVEINGFSDALDKTTFDGAFVGNLSALALDSHGRLDALADTAHLFTLHGHTLSNLKPEKAVELPDENGQAPDSEAMAIDRDGTRLITSEREPSIRRYTHDGTKVLGSLPVPDDLRIAPAGRAEFDHSFEGLALQPGGHTLVASMETALSGDDANTARFQTWQRHGKSGDFKLGPQYAYHLDTDDNGTLLEVADIAPTGDGRLLVLERAFTANVGNSVRLYLADPAHASDVSKVTHLTGQKNIRPLQKTLLADIGDCPSLGATAKEPQPNPLLDNVEGMAVTGHEPGGKLRLMLVSDDNSRDTQITRFYDMTARLPRH